MFKPQRELKFNCSPNKNKKPIILELLFKNLNLNFIENYLHLFVNRLSNFGQKSKFKFSLTYF